MRKRKEMNSRNEKGEEELGRSKDATWRHIKKLSTISMKVLLNKRITNLAHLLKQTSPY